MKRAAAESVGWLEGTSRSEESWDGWYWSAEFGWESWEWFRGEWWVWRSRVVTDWERQGHGARHEGWRDGGWQADASRAAAADSSYAETEQTEQAYQVPWSVGISGFADPRDNDGAMQP